MIIMKKLIYYIKRIFGMDYKQFFVTIDKIHKRSNKSRLYIFFDLIRCSIKYQAGYTDYFLFYFEDLNSKQRSTYVTRGVNNTYIRLLNDREYYKYFRNKVLFNDTFKKYLGRDYIDLFKVSPNEFKKFIIKHPTIIVKTIDGTGGFGVEKIKTDKNTDANKLYEELMIKKQTLVEECIKQHKDMSKLAEKSVNTLRIVTVTKSNKTHVMLKVIRFGNGINAVDNFHSGGMYTVFDDNGVIYKPAVDREGNVYTIHPVTNTKIEGFKIPYYKEAIGLAIEASKVIPQLGYVGFDIAISENGPVIVEGNELPGYDLYQSKVHLNEMKEGLKPLFDSVIYEKNQDN